MVRRPPRAPPARCALSAAGLTLLAACRGAPPADPAGDMTRLAAALELARTDPRAAADACDAVLDATLRADCRTAAAERLARSDAAAADAICDGIPAGTALDECRFQVAERSGEPARCAAAGAFADDCRLHLLSAAFRGLLPPGTAPGAFEEDLARELDAYGLAPDDPRPWSAAYRWVLGGQRPLDRGSCDAVAEPLRAEACRQTAVALLHDRLNHARDTGRFPCDGGPVPADLAWVPDPVLDAAVEARRQEDLCP